MSRFFILFLIALLPLRGWAVERMDLQQGAHTAMSAECAQHMQAAVDAHASSDAAFTGEQPAEHKTCQSCQLCMPMAALAGIAVTAVVPMPQRLAPSGSSAFLSAEAARRIKPPIS